jgi:hypothetical protein
VATIYRRLILDLDRIVRELEEERDRLSRAITLLKGVNTPGVTRRAGASSATGPKRRRGGMTPAGRKRLSELMKKRWAERRKRS